MKKILVLTKDNPVEVIDTMGRFYTAFSELDPTILVCSPQYTAYQLEQAGKASYLEALYPAIRTFKKIDNFANSETEFIVVVGVIDKKDKYNYDAIIGIDNKDIEDYPYYNEDFNTTNIELTRVENSDIIFNTIEEAIYFIRIMIEHERK